MSAARNGAPSGSGMSKVSVASGTNTTFQPRSLAWRVARGVAAPLLAQQAAADYLAEGRWGARVPVPDAREPAEAAEAFNRMADSVQKRIAALSRQNSEQKAVLASMAEGVLAVDSQERIISINHRTTINRLMRKYRKGCKSSISAAVADRAVRSKYLAIH